MSTILVTDTHIAQDFMVCELTHPHRSYIDTSHRKVFLSHDKTFYYGAVGSFSPEEVASEESSKYVKSLFEKAINAKSRCNRLFTLLDTHRDEFKELFESYIILVSKTDRFVVYIRDMFDTLGASRLSTLGSIGTDGYKGVGLLRGGLSFKDTYSALSDMSSLTSSEHRVYPLDILKDWKHHVD